MPKVDVEVGATLPLPNVEFGMIKPIVRFTGIDTDGDIEAQIKACLAAVGPISEGVEEALAQEAANASGLAVEGFGFYGEFTQYRDGTNEVLRKTIDQVKKLGTEVKELKSVDTESDGSDEGSEDS